MCEGNFEENGYQGSNPCRVDGVDYFTALPMLSHSPFEFALFGLDRNMPLWRPPMPELPVLDLGPGRKVIPGAIRIDWPEYDFEPRLGPNKIVDRKSGKVYDRLIDHLLPAGRLPYEDNSVGGVFAVNLLEHLWDPRPLIWEVARVLAPGAPFNVFVPDGRSPLYAQDLDHKKPFVLDSFRSLLANPYYAKGHPSHELELGAHFKFAVKEGNETLIFQLFKRK